jgi:MICOS complex subunit MIC26
LLTLFQIPDRKPIYTDSVPYATPAAPTLPLPNNESTQNSAPTPPTPTDRLAAQIKVLRLALYDLSLSTEKTFNNALTYTFRKETQIADTIANLAPGPETGEQLLPGAIYVLVSTLAGSIVTRNRNILLRATFPLGVGVVAGWTLIPVTMRNVGDLMWEYEKRVPVVADSHLQVRAFGEDAWRRLRESGRVVADKVDSSTGEGRKMIEGWVEKGK